MPTEAKSQMTLDFHQAIRQDPMCHAIYTNWTRGGFASFEECLMAMVLHLVQSNRKYLTMLSEIQFSKPEVTISTILAKEAEKK